MKQLIVLWSLLISFVHGIETNEDIRLALSRIILFDIYNGNLELFKKRHYSVRDSAEANENIILLSYNWTGISLVPTFQVGTPI
jgi:hypothetical protein